MDAVFDITTKDGFALGGAVGTELVPGLRAEAEITYLRQKTRNSTSSSGDEIARWSAMTPAERRTIMAELDSRPVAPGRRGGRGARQR